MCKRSLYVVQEDGMTTGDSDNVNVRGELNIT